MIASLRGEILSKDGGGLVVDCQGVGYGLQLSFSALAQIGDVGTEVRLLVHTHVSQDSFKLYGFVEAKERRCFEVLIGTSGVGPKLALAILSTFSADELVAVVARADTATLIKIPGVGRKKAERLILELKDRLPKTDLVEVSSSTTASDLAGDLMSALVGLGFRGADAEKSAQRALEEFPEEKDLARLVRTALRFSTKRS